MKLNHAVPRWAATLFVVAIMFVSSATSQAGFFDVLMNLGLNRAGENSGKNTQASSTQKANNGSTTNRHGADDPPGDDRGHHRGRGHH